MHYCCNVDFLEKEKPEVTGVRVLLSISFLILAQPIYTASVQILF